jgi:hypothetical protein
MKSYGRYFQRIHSKWRPYEHRRKYCPCPGCINHSAVIGERRAEVIFHKYVDYPQKAHSLYWRTHPTEYAAMLKIINKKSSNP